MLMCHYSIAYSAKITGKKAFQPDGMPFVPPSASNKIIELK